MSATAKSKAANADKKHDGDPKAASLLADVIEDGESMDDGESVDSDSIREQAQRILDTYNERLVKVGQRAFQVRLNIFFTFVIATSVEAEAYDYLQSVEHSVMNDSSVLYNIKDRTSSRLSQISNFQSNISD